jgi:MFS transporter, NNP family, nitrate/nitrite transporter
MLELRLYYPFLPAPLFPPASLGNRPALVCLNTMIKKENPNFRWYILLITGLTYAVIAGASRMCMPVLFKEIGDKLHLSVTAIGTVWGMDPLAGVFIGLPAGLLTDRFGVKKTLTVVCILAGIFGALRGFSVNFLTMAGTMFLFGLLSAAVPSIIPKATAEWFGGKRLALANGMLNVMWSLGSMAATMFSATVLSPALGGWNHVVIFFAVPCVLLGFLWMFTGRDPAPTKDKDDLPVPRIPFREAFSQVIRMKGVWLIGLATLMNWGASMGFVGYLPLYLRNSGWSETAADSTITIMSGMMLLGSIPMVLLSDKLKTRKGVLMIALGAFISCLFLVPFVNRSGIWALVIISSFLRAGAGSLYNVMIFEMEGVGARYGGTAIGLANTISMAGAFLAPPIGNHLSSIGPAAPFIFWGCLAAGGIPLILSVKSRPFSTR